MKYIRKIVLINKIRKKCGQVFSSHEHFNHLKSRGIFLLQESTSQFRLSIHIIIKTKQLTQKRILFFFFKVWVGGLKGYRKTLNYKEHKIEFLFV